MLSLFLYTLLQPALALAADGVIPDSFANRPVTSGNAFQGGLLANFNDTLNDFLDDRLLPFIFLLLGATAVILLIVAGIQYMTAAGNPDAVKKARQSITNIILGIVLLTASYGIIALILGTIEFLAKKAG